MVCTLNKSSFDPGKWELFWDSCKTQFIIQGGRLGVGSEESLREASQRRKTRAPLKWSRGWLRERLAGGGDGSLHAENVPLEKQRSLWPGALSHSWSWELGDTGFYRALQKPNIRFTKITLFREGKDFILPCLSSPNLSEEPGGSAGEVWNVVCWLFSNCFLYAESDFFFF